MLRLTLEKTLEEGETTRLSRPRHTRLESTPCDRWRSGGFRRAARDRLARLALSTLLALASPALLPAVKVEPSLLYSGGTRLEGNGVAFTVPEGWQGSWPSKDEAFRMHPTSDADVTILASSVEWARDQAAAAMADEIPIDGGMFLQPAAAVEHRGRALVGRYNVAGTDPPLEAYAEVIPGEWGNSVTYLLMAPGERLSRWIPAVQRLTDTTAITAPGGGGSWAAYLRGKHLLRDSPRSGFIVEQRLWLCSNGTFYRKDTSRGFGGGASGGLESNSTGRWRATGGGARGDLTLDDSDGGQTVHQLFWDDKWNDLQLDGEVWGHDENEECD